MHGNQTVCRVYHTNKQSGNKRCLAHDVEDALYALSETKQRHVNNNSFANIDRPHSALLQVPDTDKVRLLTLGIGI